MAIKCAACRAPAVEEIKAGPARSLFRCRACGHQWTVRLSSSLLGKDLEQCVREAWQNAVDNGYGPELRGIGSRKAAVDLTTACSEVEGADIYAVADILERIWR